MNKELSIVFFRQNAEWRFYLVSAVVRRRSSFVFHHKMSPLYSHAGNDVNNYFLTEVIARKPSKMLPPTTSDSTSQEWFKRASQNFTHLSVTTGLRSFQDMTSLAASSRLQNATKYCTKVGKTCLADKNRITRSLFNLKSPNFTQNPYRPGMQLHWIQRHQLLLIGSYQSSKRKRPKMLSPMALDRILVTLRFAWPNQLVGFLLSKTPQAFLPICHCLRQLQFVIHSSITK